MNSVLPFSLFSEQDVYLFREGKHFRLYEKFGAHSTQLDGVAGVCFSVWAPHAASVAVMGSFNGWDTHQHTLFPRWDGSGIWEGFIPGLDWGTLYKYAIRTADGEILEKSDPFALGMEQSRQAASLVSTTYFDWEDAAWMQGRHEKNSLNAPISVYEFHLGSWMRSPDNPERFLSYRQIAGRLVPYLQEMEFTHVEFMPVMEHPYEPSWGYQITGFYAANSRFGPPQDLMFLINELHRNGIGVILDWVPSHFPGDANGLHFFDGTPLYEYADARKGFHPQWNSWIFDYGKNEVRSFLISNAAFWLDRYHADGLRVDAVTSILYLDYARNDGEWQPNIFGGNVNLEAKSFLQEMNTEVYRSFPGIITIAEESSDFPLLTKPVDSGGIGFGMKWMMGWMHDTLKYFKEDPINRKHHHHKITFSSAYRLNENYMMPLSHDEVVHGKASMIYKMPGDEWQKFANLRALYGFMFTHPGAKLLFMGNEFGQTNEWRFTESLSWHLLEFPVHKGLQLYIKELNHLYRTEPSLYEAQFEPGGFEWVEADDAENSIYVYLRKDKSGKNTSMTVLNLTPRVVEYKIGVAEDSAWTVVLNSDDGKFGGSGVKAEQLGELSEEWMGRPKAIVLRLPALSALILKEKKMKTKSEKPRKTSTVKSKAEPLISASNVTDSAKEVAISAKEVSKNKVAKPRKTSMAKSKAEPLISASNVTDSAKEVAISAKEISANKVTKPRKTSAAKTKAEPIVSASNVTDSAKEVAISAKKVSENKVAKPRKTSTAKPKVEPLISASNVTDSAKDVAISAKKVSESKVAKPRKTSMAKSKAEPLISASNVTDSAKEVAISAKEISENKVAKPRKTSTVKPKVEPIVSASNVTDSAKEVAISVKKVSESKVAKPHKTSAAKPKAEPIVSASNVTDSAKEVAISAKKVSENKVTKPRKTK